MFRTKGVVAAAALATALAITTEASAQVVVVERRRARPVYVRRVVRVPPGWHVEERPRTGLIVSGAVLSGFGTAFVVGGAVDATNRGRWSDGDEVSAIVGGIFLAIGLPLLITGLTTHRRVLVRDAYVAPIVGPQMTGGAFGVRF